MPKAQSVFSAMYGWKPPELPKTIEVKSSEPGGGVRLEGKFKLRHFRSAVLIDDREVKNTIVDVGKAGVAGLIIQTGSTSPFSYIALGTGTNATSTADTALQTEISTGGGERALATLSRVTTTVTNDTAQLVHTFTFTGSYAVTEAGVFNSSSSGATMLSRKTFTPVSVVAADTLAVTYQIGVTGST